jgi:hypothetical protein
MIVNDEQNILIRVGRLKVEYLNPASNQNGPLSQLDISFQRRTKTTKFQVASLPEIWWFWSKWVYKFLPSQKLVHLSGYFPFIQTSHRGWSTSHKIGAKSSSL